MPKKLIALRLDPKELKQLERIAKADDRSVSYVIRKAIEKYVKENK